MISKGKKMKVDETQIDIDTDGVVLWQYDKSPRLLAMLGMLKSCSMACCTDFENNFLAYVMTIPNSSTEQDQFGGIGLVIWGNAIGLKRPTVTVEGVSRPISDETYKKILTARFHQMFSAGNVESLNEFMYSIFGNTAFLKDNNDMTLTLVVSYSTGNAELDSLLSSGDDILQILELPIGVGLTHETTPTGTFGLNFTDSEGQNLENFAISESSDNGGTMG